VDRREGDFDKEEQENGQRDKAGSQTKVMYPFEIV
jgi:hypothetical protein